MALDIAELYGFAPGDNSSDAKRARSSLHCPFIKAPCTKAFNDSSPNGACTLVQKTAGPVICCPNRLYADDYQVLLDIAVSAFGEGVRLINSPDLSSSSKDGRNVVVFGKRWGKELSLPSRGSEGRGGFVDWILALVGLANELLEFVAIEVQSMDTTGNYRALRDSYMAGKGFQTNPAGINWRNVFKRILPQLIYKGHILRRERLCKSGLFFVCPSPVYQKIRMELSDELLEYQRQPGSLTFKWYNINDFQEHGRPRRLVCDGEFTTTVEQVAQALGGQQSLPPAGVYEKAIKQEFAKA